MSKTNKKAIDNLNEKINIIADQTEKILHKVTKQDESFEYYTEKEIEYLDKFKVISGDAFDEDELYDIIIKHNFDDRSIRKEVEEAVKLVKRRGEEYGWTKIEKGKKAKKIEKFQPEVKVTQRKTKTTKYRKELGNGEYNPSRNKEHDNPQNTYEVQERDVLEHDRGYNNQYYNYGYNNYRTNNRGKNYYRGRGSQRGRGRSQKFHNRNYYSEDQLFEHHFGNKSDEKPEDNQANKEVIQEEDQKEENDQQNIVEDPKSLLNLNKFSNNKYDEGEKRQEEHFQNSHTNSKINDQSHSRTHNFNDENKSYTTHSHHQNNQTQNKTQQQNINNETYSNTQHHTKPTHTDTVSNSQHHTKPTHTDTVSNSQHPSKTSYLHQSNKQNSSDEDVGVFSTKDIPSNIRNNIKDLIEENDNPPKKEIQFSNNGEFAVHKISISIDNENKIDSKSNQNQNKQSLNSNTQHRVSNTNFFVPQSTKKQPTTSTGVNSNHTLKKSEKSQQVGASGHFGGVNATSQTNQSEYQNAGQIPWAMGPMGFYFPQPVSYDNQNQMGMNNSMYPMMPMYYYPYFNSTRETDDNSSMKNKQMGFNNNPTFGLQSNSGNEMNQQMNQGNIPPQFTPFYYYNPQNPYNQMGMNMPGMNMMNSQLDNNQNFSENYELKNMKNTNETNPNFYGYNFYKQG